MFEVTADVTENMEDKDNETQEAINEEKYEYICKRRQLTIMTEPINTGFLYFPLAAVEEPTSVN